MSARELAAIRRLFQYGRTLIEGGEAELMSLRVEKPQKGDMPYLLDHLRYLGDALVFALEETKGVNLDQLFFDAR